MGLGTVRELLDAKAYVSILDRSSPPTDLPSAHLKFFETDVTKPEQVESAVDGTVAWTKETGAALGGLIACAGVGIAAKVLDSQNQPHSLDLWNFVLDVNLTGTFNLTRLVLKHLVDVKPENGEDAERGVVIMVSSAAAVSALLSLHFLADNELLDSLKDSLAKRPTRRRRVLCAP